MGFNKAASGTGSTLYCGDPGLICALVPSFTHKFDMLAGEEELSAHLAIRPHDVACLILTLSDEQAGRLRIPSDEYLTQRTHRLLQVLRNFDQVSSSPARIILLTQSGLSLETCCEFVKAGVGHFVDMDASGWDGRLLDLVEAVGCGHRHAVAMRDPQELLDAVGIRAISPAMQALILHVYRGAQVSDATVLIQGESGTGKQLLAEAIHHLDPKRAQDAFHPRELRGDHRHAGGIGTLWSFERGVFGGDGIPSRLL